MSFRTPTHFFPPGLRNFQNRPSFFLCSVRRFFPVSVPPKIAAQSELPLFPRPDGWSPARRPQKNRQWSRQNGLIQCPFTPSNTKPGFASVLGANHGTPLYVAVIILNRRIGPIANTMTQAHPRNQVPSASGSVSKTLPACVAFRKPSFLQQLKNTSMDLTMRECSLDHSCEVSSHMTPLPSISPGALSPLSQSDPLTVVQALSLHDSALWRPRRSRWRLHFSGAFCAKTIGLVMQALTSPVSPTSRHYACSSSTNGDAAMPSGLTST